LVSNGIAYLIEDGEDQMWIGSNAGLMRVARRALNEFARGAVQFVTGRVYRKADGLPAGEATFGSQPAACRTPDGRLWFPTIKGLASVHPDQLKPNPRWPPVVIESVLLDGQSQNTNSLRTAWPEAIVVSAGTERIEIHYTSLNLAAPGRARFKYRLEGHESAWTEVGNTRVTWYSKLSPGRYRFIVTACNEDGVWNPAGTTVAFVVEPPVWRTWWFLTSATIALLGLIVGVVHHLSTQRLQRQLEGMRQKEALEKERGRIARDLHDQVGASLTQMSLLGELVDSDKDLPGEVESHAKQITQTARETTHVLDEIVWAVNPSNDTLDSLITYACKYAQDYLAVAGLRYRLEVPPQLPAAPIAPDVRHNVFLAFKEAVTNVVKHSGADEAHVRFSLDDARFTLEVEDNGRGLAGMDSERARTRNGLRNMRRRMEDVGGSFSISPAPARGTVVRLTAPVGPARSR
jgi:signal transduction histidine kinase